MERVLAVIGGIEAVIGGAVILEPSMVPDWVGILLVVHGGLSIGYGIWGKRRPRAAYSGTWVPDRWWLNWEIRIKAKG